MISTFNLNFALKKSKLLANGTAPIYIRLTINGNRIEFTTKRYIIPSKWNSTAQKMSGTHEEARSLNLYLKSLEQQVYDAHRQLMEAKVQITVQSLKDKLFGKEVKPEIKTILPIFREHNRRLSVLVGKDYSAGTLVCFTTTLKHLTNFIKWHYQVADVDIAKIDHEFITTFEFFLRSEKACSNNTTLKYIKNFKKIIRICLNSGWLDKDPFRAFKAKLSEVVPAFLTKSELHCITQKEFVSDRITQVRDIFLFSCYTGLAYADVKKLKRTEVVVGFDGEQWVSTSRQKTDTASRIPLLPVSRDIINRYADHPQCQNEGRLLPVLSNQKMNAYLKEIADICGINKQLTYHTARHTFATTVTLSNGVPIETVSKMLGHKSIKTTQHYARILDVKVSEDMEILKKKLLNLILL